MARIVIEDPNARTGAQVASDGLLKTQSRNETQKEHELEQGNVFNLQTGDVSLTGTSSSSVLYFKNLGDTPIRVDGIAWLLAETDGTFGSWLTEVIFNPTGGTLISTATVLTPVNLLVGDNNSLSTSNDATIYSGTYGLTATGGTTAIQSRFSSNGRYYIPVAFELPKNQSFALRVTPPGSTTAGKIQVACSPYKRTTEL